MAEEEVEQYKKQIERCFWKTGDIDYIEGLIHAHMNYFSGQGIEFDGEFLDRVRELLSSSNPQQALSFLLGYITREIVEATGGEEALKGYAGELEPLIKGEVIPEYKPKTPAVPEGVEAHPSNPGYDPKDLEKIVDARVAEYLNSPEGRDRLVDAVAKFARSGKK